MKKSWGACAVPTYKDGKKTKPIELKYFKEVMKKGEFKAGDYHRSFLAFLYWFGVRRGEALNMKPSDFTFDKKENVLVVNCPATKGGEREPLEIGLNMPYVLLILREVLRATKEGRKKVWGFSHGTAWLIVRRAMGRGYYPHFFRLNRATRFLEDPTTTLPEMQAWFGWKAIKTVDPYVGYSRRHIRKQSKRLEKEVEKK